MCSNQQVRRPETDRGEPGGGYINGSNDQGELKPIPNYGGQWLLQRVQRDRAGVAGCRWSRRDR